VTSSRKLLFLFLDGVGLGEDDPNKNPFAQVSLPHLEGLLEGYKLVLDGSHAENHPLLVDTPRANVLAVDATLGVEGLPQSATGQASLLTGKNVPAWLGEHEGPKPTPPIIDLLNRGTVFTQLHEQGNHATLANAYPPRYFESIERGYRLPVVIALAARQVGMHLHTRDDLYAGRALSVDFSGEGWRSNLGFDDTPIITLEQAGKRLKALSDQADLTVFEYWLTDVAGHHQDAVFAETILKELDEVIGTIAGSMDGAECLLLVTSDHGNLEDMSTRHHTRNDVPLLLIGSKEARSDFLAGLKAGCKNKPDLTSIGPAMVKFIG
jgi:2,3-bisphosphoglycerate-independent phosphoglycerate mutase